MSKRAAGSEPSNGNRVTGWSYEYFAGKIDGPPFKNPREEQENRCGSNHGIRAQADIFTKYIFPVLAMLWRKKKCEPAAGSGSHLFLIEIAAVDVQISCQLRKARVYFHKCRLPPRPHWSIKTDHRAVPRLAGTHRMTIQGTSEGTVPERKLSTPLPAAGQQGRWRIAQSNNSP